MTDIKRYPATARMSAMVEHGSTLYLKGVTPGASIPDTIADQTRDVLRQIEALLAQGGSSLQQMLAVNIWLRDIKEIDGMNAVYDAWLKPGHEPVRACVQAQLAKPQYRLEIQVVASR